MATVSGTTSYTVLSPFTTVSGTAPYTVVSANASLRTVSGTSTYAVVSRNSNAVSGTTTYTVTTASAVKYPVLIRVGNTLKPVQLGKRRGNVIDWLTPNLP